MEIGHREFPKIDRFPFLSLFTFYFFIILLFLLTNLILKKWGAEAPPASPCSAVPDNWWSMRAIRLISNGNRTEWSPIRSVIIRVITKSDSRCAVVRFVYREYYYRRIGQHEVLLPINNKNYNNPRYEKGKFTLKVFTMFLWWLKTRL